MYHKNGSQVQKAGITAWKIRPISLGQFSLICFICFFTVEITYKIKIIGFFLLSERKTQGQILTKKISKQLCWASFSNLSHYCPVVHREMPGRNGLSKPEAASNFQFLIKKYKCTDKILNFDSQDCYFYCAFEWLWLVLSTWQRGNRKCM